MEYDEFAKHGVTLGCDAITQAEFDRVKGFGISISSKMNMIRNSRKGVTTAQEISVYVGAFLGGRDISTADKPLDTTNMHGVIMFDDRKKEIVDLLAFEDFSIQPGKMVEVEAVIKTTEKTRADGSTYVSRMKTIHSSRVLSSHRVTAKQLLPYAIGTDGLTADIEPFTPLLVAGLIKPTGWSRCPIWGPKVPGVKSKPVGYLPTIMNDQPAIQFSLQGPTNLRVTIGPYQAKTPTPPYLVFEDMLVLANEVYKSTGDYNKVLDALCNALSFQPVLIVGSFGNFRESEKDDSVFTDISATAIFPLTPEEWAGWCKDVPQVETTASHTYLAMSSEPTPLPPISPDDILNRMVGPEVILGILKMRTTEGATIDVIAQAISSIAKSRKVDITVPVAKVDAVLMQMEGMDQVVSVGDVFYAPQFAPEEPVQLVTPVTPQEKYAALGGITQAPPRPIVPLGASGTTTIASIVTVSAPGPSTCPICNLAVKRGGVEHDGRTWHKSHLEGFKNGKMKRTDVVVTAPVATPAPASIPIPPAVRTYPNSVMGQQDAIRKALFERGGMTKDELIAASKLELGVKGTFTGEDLANYYVAIDTLIELKEICFNGTVYLMMSRDIPTAAPPVNSTDLSPLVAEARKVFGDTLTVQSFIIYIKKKDKTLLAGVSKEEISIAIAVPGGAVVPPTLQEVLISVKALLKGHAKGIDMDATIQNIADARGVPADVIEGIVNELIEGGALEEDPIGTLK